VKTVIGVLKVEASIIQTVFRPVGHLAGPRISVVVGDKTADGAKESCNDKEREEESSSRGERGESKENREKSDAPAKVTVISGVRVAVKEEPKE